MKKFYLFVLVAMIMTAGRAMAQQDAEHPWAGTFTLMIPEDEPFHYLSEGAEEWNVATPDTFQVVVEWNAEAEQYRITTFYDLTTDHLTEGSFELKVIDEKNAQIILVKEAYHLFGIQPAGTFIEDGEEVTYEKDTEVTATLCDGGNNTWSYEPIPVHMNSDGQISIDGFKILYRDRYSTGWIAWADGAVPLNGGDEPAVIEPRDWTGWYWMTVPANYHMSLDENVYPLEGAFEIKKDDWDNFIVTKFLGYNTADANAFSGGIYITPSKKNANKATIDCDEYMNILKTTDDSGLKGLVLADGAAQNGPIEITWDEETQTITFDIFSFLNWDATSGEAPTEAALYFSATAEKKDPSAIENVTTQALGNEYYDLSGRRLSKPAKGINIVRSANGEKNGKKVIIK